MHICLSKCAYLLCVMHMAQPLIGKTTLINSAVKQEPKQTWKILLNCLAEMRRRNDWVWTTDFLPTPVSKDAARRITATAATWCATRSRSLMRGSPHGASYR